MLTQQPENQQVSQDGYNGVIEFQDKKIDVHNGVAKYEGEVFYVSKDGNFVINQQREVVGSIRNGKFAHYTPELGQQLKDLGIIEVQDEQPKGTTLQT